jgi:hypothetical protein
MKSDCTLKMEKAYKKCLLYKKKINLFYMSEEEPRPTCPPVSTPGACENRFVPNGSDTKSGGKTDIIKIFSNKLYFERLLNEKCFVLVRVGQQRKLVLV